MPESDEKQADSAFGLLNYPMAAMALLTILGTGGSAYLTKKVLDEKLHESQTNNLDVPKVRRIVLQSAPDVTKQASEDEREAVAAGLVVMMDYVGGTNRFLGHPTVKSAMAQIGGNPFGLKETGNHRDWDTIMGTLKDHPDLRKSLYSLFVDYTGKNKMSRGLQHLGLMLPGATQMADRRLYNTLSKVRYQVPPGGAKEVQMAPKTAQDVASVGTSILGSLMGKKITGTAEDPQVLAKAIVEAEKESDRTQKLQHTKVHDTVRVEAKDPKSQEYLEHNKARIQGLVRRLAQEGQI